MSNMIIDGRPGIQFRPGDAISDEHAASMFAALAAFRDTPLPPKNYEEPTPSPKAPASVTEVKPTAEETKSEAPASKKLAGVRKVLGKIASTIARPFKAITHPLWDTNYVSKREQQQSNDYLERLNSRLDKLAMGKVAVVEAVVQTTIVTERIVPHVWRDLVAPAPSQAWTDEDTQQFHAFAKQDTAAFARQ